MDKESKNELKDNTRASGQKYFLSVSIVVSALIVAGGWIYSAGLRVQKPAADKLSAGLLETIVLPADGVVLPVRWGDLGVKLVNDGVIDQDKLEAIYAARGGLSAGEKALLEKTDNGNLKMTPENANYLLNLLWALGLGNKNEILEKGPMADPRYGGADKFASTGGWTIAKGDAMGHYSRYPLAALTPEQQQLVEKISKNIYRPCCNNPVYFPDCNHGMAMLGLLELMASQGVGEDEMYRVALKVNSYWFPDTYLTIAKYLQSIGTSWDKMKPKDLLGAQFSSASGYGTILQKVAPPQGGSGGGCGV